MVTDSTKIYLKEKTMSNVEEITNKIAKAGTKLRKITENLTSVRRNLGLGQSATASVNLRADHQFHEPVYLFF